MKRLFYILLLIIPRFVESQTYTISAYNGQKIKTCSGSFFDSGDNAGDYGNNESYTVTFCAISGRIKLDFSALNLRSEGGDTLKIYDGNDTSAKLIGQYTGTGLAFSVQSKDSCLTFKFTSDGSLTNGGWNAAISCCPIPSTSVISGLTSVCAGTTGTNYSVVNTPGSTYQWFITGGSQAGGGISNNITVNWGILPGSCKVKVVENNGCTTGDTVSLNITLHPLPSVSFSGLDSIYDIHLDGAVTLIGSPVGGTFSGAGIAGSVFNPLTAGLGKHPIRYSYTDVNGCSNSSTQNTDVRDYNARAGARLIGNITGFCSSNAAYSNSTATGDGSAGSCWSGGTDHNVWFRFYAPATAVKVDLITGGVFGTMRGQQLAIWTEAGAQLACNDAGWNYSGTLSLSLDNLIAGKAYYISVDDQTTHGTFTLCTNDAPGYDLRSGAFLINNINNWCSSNAQFSNNLTTGDGSAGSCWSGGTDHNVWFKYVATTRAVKIDILTGGVYGTMRGQQVAIWNASGAEVACNDAGWNYSGSISLGIDTLTIGRTYYISVDDQTTHGSFSLCIDDDPGYDFKSGAFLLSSIALYCSSNAQFDNLFATRDASAGSCWSGGTDHNVWFKFVAETRAIKADIKTGGALGTMRGQQIAIWNMSGMQVACNDAGWNYSGILSLSIDTLTAGRTYYISVDDQTTHGSFTLCADNKTDYDFKSGAEFLYFTDNWCSSDAQYDNRFATRDGSAGSCWSGGTDHNVWFEFVAETGGIKADVKTGGTLGTMRGQQIAIWNSNGAQLACNDAGWNYSGTLSLSIDTLTVGRHYFISIDDQTTHGSFALCMNNKVGYDFETGAVFLSDIDHWCSSDALYDNRFATRDGNAGSCWSGGTDHNVWFKFIAVSGQFEVDVKTGGTTGTMRGQQIAIWNNAGAQVACIDAGWNYSGTLSLITDTLTSGNTYYISVDDQTTHGSFTLCANNKSGYDFKSGAVLLSAMGDWCSSDAQFDNRFATRDGSAGSCWSGGTDHNVWFKFIASTTAAKVDVKTGGSFGTMRGQQIAIWNEAGTQIACNDAGWNYSGTLSLGIDTLKSGNTYYISVDDQTTHGTFSLCLDDEPGYDFHSGALLLSDTHNWCSSDAFFANTFATRDGSAGSCWSGGTDHNVWFKFIAASNSAEVQVKTGGTSGTMRGQQIAIWNASGIRVGCIDAGWNFSGTLTLSADTLTAGRTYFISVDDQTTHGTFTLCISNLPGFDFKAGALLLADIDNWCGSDAQYDNRFATPDETAGSCWSGGTDHNVWFRFVAISGQVQVDVKTGGIQGTMRGQQIAIWNASGTQLACIDGGWNYSGTLSLSIDTLTAGRSYYISVDDQTTHGSFALCVNNKVGYDFRQGAVVINNLDKWCSSNAQYDNQFATGDGSAGACWTGGTDHNVWFTFTALFDTAVISVTTGGAYGTMRGQQIAVWTSAGVQVACTNTAWNYSGASTINLNTLIAGNTYYISVDDRTTHGSFTLCVNNVSGKEFWAIASGNWNTASNWSRTEGGPPASVSPSGSNVVHIKGYSITVTGNEACARVDLPVANNNTYLIIDGGKLDVNGLVNMTNSGANFAGKIQVKNGGNLVIDQNLTFVRNGGNTNFGMDITETSVVTVDQDFTITSSAGTATSNLINISNTGTLNVTRDLTLSNTGGPKTTLVLNNSSVYNAHRDIYLTASAQDKVEIQMNDNSILNLYGNFRRGSPAYGRFLSNGSSNLVFIGSSYLQTWPKNTGSGTDGFTYQNVTINNTKVTTPQVILDGQVTVNGSVTFTRGIVSTTAVNLLVLANGAAVSGASDNSFVDGPVQKAGNTSFTYPTGNSGNYQPVILSAPSLITDAFTVQYINANPHPTYNNTLRVPSLTNISECEYWSVTRSAGTSNVSATLAWDSHSCCIGSLSNLKVAVWEGAQWTDHGNGGTTGTVSAGTIITATSISQNSNIVTFANTLPIVSFSGLAGPYCASAGPVTLTGSPLGATGVFTGTGITDNGNGTALFIPGNAGAGTFTITYTYTDPVNGCSNTQSQQVTVYANPKASMNQSAVVCSGSKADLNIFFTGTAPWNYQYTDGTSIFSGTTSSNPYSFQVTLTGTYQVTSLTDAHGCIASDFGSSATISNYPPLSKPIIDITGPTTFCEGSSVTLSTIPAGSFAIWSTGEASYSVVIEETGDYNVKIVDNHNCVSPYSDNTHVTVNKVPRKPSNITGNTSICQNGPSSALSTFSAYATSYNWSISPVSAGSFSGNTASVTLTWDPMFTGVASITVTGSNALCSDGPVSNPLVITVNALPANPGAISGPVSVCRSTGGVIYSISPVANAISYTWTLPAGATISGPSTGNSISVDFNGAATDGNITVTGVNGCGNSFSQSVLPVVLHARPNPGLTGSVLVNMNDIVIYSSDAGKSNYVWSVSAGGQITSGGGNSDPTVTIKWITGGVQTVSVNYADANNCNALSPTSLLITVNELPTKPGTPTGVSEMCSDSPDTPYSTTGATGASSYVWVISPPAAGTINGTGLTGTVSWVDSWYGTAVITVTGHNASGDGPVSDPLSVVVHKIPETGVLYNIPSH
jgi:DNA polymerase/3'-5' exonuclease PolX